MRTFCLFLLLANALFFGWAELIDVRAGDLQRRSTGVNPPARIMLAREAAASGGPESLASAAQASASAVSSGSGPEAALPPAPATHKQAGSSPAACTSVGPFAESSESATAEAALRQAGFQPRQRMVQGEMWVGYWVSVQGLPSRDAANQALKLLADKGMNDVYVLPGSESGNVLSLGVFSDRQRAQRRAEDARSAGLNPRIDDRKRAGAVYWLDVDQPEPIQPVDTSIFQTEPGKINRLELRACPS
jgi:hypothetical protein